MQARRTESRHPGNALALNLKTNHQSTGCFRPTSGCGRGFAPIAETRIATTTNMLFLAILFVRISIPSFQSCNCTHLAQTKKGEADGSADPSMLPDKRGCVRNGKEFRPSKNPHNAIVALYPQFLTKKASVTGGFLDRPSGAEGIRTPARTDRRDVVAAFERRRCDLRRAKQTGP